jgi:hypothetical protein
MCPKLILFEYEARFHLRCCLNSQNNTSPALIRKVPLHEIMVGVWYAASATRIPASLLRPQFHADILLIFLNKLSKTAQPSMHCLQTVFGDRKIIRGLWSNNLPDMKPRDLTLVMELVQDKCIVLNVVLKTM